MVPSVNHEHPAVNWDQHKKFLQFLLNEEILRSKRVHMLAVE